MRLRDFFVYNPLLNIIICTLIIVLVFLLPIKELFCDNKLDENDNQNSDDNPTQKEKKNVIEIIVNLIPAFCIAIIFIIAYHFRIRLLIALFALPLFLERINELCENAEMTHRNVLNRIEDLSVQGRASIVACSGLVYLIPQVLPSNLQDIVIDGDINIIVVMILSYWVLFFSLFCLVGFFIGEIARKIENKERWKVLRNLSRKIYTHNLSIQEIIRSMLESIRNKRVPARALLYVAIFALCFIVFSIYSIVFMFRWVLSLIIMILSYCIRMLEYCLNKVRGFSDSRFISLSVRMAVIGAIITTEIKLLNNNMVSASSLTAFEYLSQAVLIPIIISEALSIRNGMNHRVT